jgi:hypothetical protein
LHRAHRRVRLTLEGLDERALPSVIDGILYHVPVGGEMPEIGAVVAYADSIDEAKRLVRERAEIIKGYQLVIHTDALDSAEEEIEQAASFGIEF